jgi:hypothetical protein
LGQANLRGAFEDRKNKPLIPNFDKMTVAEKKTFFNCPESAIFKGYVIHSEKREDFLAKSTEDKFTIRREYCKRPQDALIFDTYKKAEKISKLVPTNCLIGVLFEYDEMMGVWFLERT